MSLILITVLIMVINTDNDVDNINNDVANNNEKTA